MEIVNMEFMSTFLLIFAISFCILAKWNGKKDSKLRLPPSLPSLPIVGSLPFLRNFFNISEFFQEKSKELGAIFTFRVGNKLVLILNNTEAIEEALVKKSRSFTSRPDIYVNKLVNPQNKGNLCETDAEKWKRVNKTVLSIMREFGLGVKSVMEERIRTETEAMTDFVLSKKGKTFNPKELSIQITSNIILNIFFGWRQDYSLGIPELIYQIDRYMHSFDMVFDVAPFLRFIPPFKHKISVLKEASRKIYDIIEQEIRKCLKNQENCFVTRYVEKEGPNADQEQLLFLLRDMITGGTDTTAITIQWSLVALANHPQIQSRLQRDVDSVIPRGCLPTLEHQSSLPYVEATILELYRWRTLVPLSIARSCSSESVVGGYRIPAGTLVLPNLYASNNDSASWKDPDVFQPERFLDEENNVIHRDRVIAFSLGRRSCPGEILARSEIFLILTSLLQRFTVLPPEGQERVCEELFLPVSVVIQPTAFTIRLVERDF